MTILQVNLKIKSVFFLLALICFGCNDSDYKPKPKGFNYIELEEKEYELFSNETDPFQFEYPKSAKIEEDTVLYGGVTKEHYKIITYPGFNSKIHLTYKKIGDDSLDSYINESYRLAYGHDVKAYGITSEELKNRKGYYTTLIELEGNVPSQFQFFVHDSTKHFIRGALYFPTAMKNDSLKPVINYVKEDIVHMLQTLTWQDEK